MSFLNNELNDNLFLKASNYPTAYITYFPFIGNSPLNIEFH